MVCYQVINLHTVFRQISKSLGPDFNVVHVSISQHNLLYYVTLGFFCKFGRTPEMQVKQSKAKLLQRERSKREDLYLHFFEDNISRLRSHTQY